MYEQGVPCLFSKAGFGATGFPVKAMKSLPKGSHVVFVGVCYGVLVRVYSVPPTQELHRRVWVDTGPLVPHQAI